MRLRTINESILISENYPPGAEHDSRAPWNQKSAKEEKKSFDSEVEDEDASKHKVKVTYWYQEPDDSIRKLITHYEHKFETEPNIPKDYVDEIIRDLIADDIGDKYYEFA